MRMHENLGDSPTTDDIVASVIEFARAQWPSETAKAEAWINQQLATYGISYAKYQAQQAAATVNVALAGFAPLLWIGGGVLLIMALRKRS